jgi:hypothetical protein
LIYPTQREALGKPFKYGMDVSEGQAEYIGAAEVAAQTQYCGGVLNMPEGDGHLGNSWASYSLWRLQSPHGLKLSVLWHLGLVIWGGIGIYRSG